jgi:hypothetical protein
LRVELLGLSLILLATTASCEIGAPQGISPALDRSQWTPQQQVQNRVLEQHVESSGGDFQVCARLRNVGATPVYETNVDDQLVVHTRSPDGRYDVGSRPSGFVPRMTLIPFPTWEERFYDFLKPSAFIEKCNTYRFDDLTYEAVVVQSIWMPGLYAGAPLPDPIREAVATGAAKQPLEGGVSLYSNLCRISRATRKASCETSSTDSSRRSQ